MSGPVAVWEVRWSKNPPSGGILSSDALRELLPRVAKKWTFQEEKGDGGYEHYQGRISLFKKRRKAEVMKLMQSIECPVPEYLQPTTSGEHQKTAFYAMKADTRVAGPWSDKDKVVWMAPEYAAPAGGWWPWQRDVIASLQVRDRRTINLVVDPRGNNGKTHLAMHLEQSQQAVVLPTLQDAKELCECVCDELMSAEERDPKLVLLDLPRAMSKKALSGIFTAIENIKNGKVVDRRYSYRKWFFRPPQVWVFTNRMPNMAYMSDDWWRVWSIDPERELVPCEFAGPRLPEPVQVGAKPIDRARRPGVRHRAHLSALSAPLSADRAGM